MAEVGGSMIKATGIGPSGNKTLFIGLSFSNLDRFYKEPLDTYITIVGKEIELPFDVTLFSGKTEADMMEMVSKGFGPDTKVIVDPKLKS
jgi:hypothetical protein